ncbi:MAG: TRAP transporter substrate-binding protein DctP [Gammaproteobacteria bacterium]|nr:TRAP transporter substrate-binding protein DctP [Gammaproteobacteria bacterium]
MIKPSKVFFSSFFLVIFLLSSLSPAQGKTFKIATLSPEGSDWMQKMRTGAKRIQQRTNGRVKFKFYPGGVMGDDQAVLRKIRIGQLHGGALSGGSIIKANPDYRIYGLLLSYQNQGEIDFVRRHIDPVIKKDFEKGGYVILGMAESGFVYAMSTKQAVHNVTQLRQQKVWVPSNDRVSQETLQSFGVTAIPLAYGDVLAGLQTGLINTVAMSPIGAIALQWHTQIKFITDMPLLYSLGVLTIDKKAFKKIKPDDKKIVREIMSEVFAQIDSQNRKNNIEALKVLRQLDIKFIKPSIDDKKQWQQLADRANKKLVDSGLLNSNRVRQVDQLLSQYRQEN